MPSLYASTITREQREAVDAALTRLAAEGTRQAGDAAKVRDYLDALRQEARDLDVLYGTTVAHATEIENELLRRNTEVSEFLANMSHELRTPLNAVIGYAELSAEVAEAEGVEALRDDLNRICSGARHLLGLINDVLDLSKIEAGRVELVIEAFEVRHLVEEVVDTLEPLAIRHGNRLVARVDTDARMEGDATRLRQCLINLAGNACKFTRDGSVTMAATLNGDHIDYIVSDTGIGMNEEQLEKLFQPFAQASSETARLFGGTGLGLALTRRLCEAMGGRLIVESVPGSGSTFTLRMPVGPDRIVTPRPKS